MKKLKQVICGLMACLMLADPVSMCSTAYANENEPAEPEAILRMEPVEQEGTSLLQEAEQQESGEPEQAAAETTDTAAPVIDLGSIRLEKTQIASGESNTLYVSAADESEIVSISARFMRETGQEFNYSTSEITLVENGQYALPVAIEIVGMWQLFSISTADIYGNTITYLNSAHPKYQTFYGTENLCDLSAIVFEVKMDSFATPVIDLTSLSIDKSVSRNRETLKISAYVENPDSVRQLSIDYRVATSDGKSTDKVWLSYNANLDKFRDWFYPSYFGKYEAERIELLDYSGEWQYIYNSALTYNWTFPEEAVMYDLSALNFDSIDAQIYTMESLKAALAEAQDGERLQIAASENLVIDEDITIPEGVYLNIQSGSGSFKIAEGVTFTTGSRFNCYVPMTVEGTWLNRSAYVSGLTISASGLIENSKDMYVENFRVEGGLKNGEQASISMSSNLALATTGSLENYGRIYLYGNLELNGTITEHPGSHIYYTYKAKTLDELKELLKRVKAGDTVEVDPGDSAFVISEDVSVPEGVRLNISGDMVINAGVTFSTANLDVRGVTVNGTWENRGNTSCQEEVYVADTGIIRHSKGNVFYCWGGLRIAEGGLVENGGYLQVDGKFENLGALTNNTGATARLVLSVRNAAELKAAFACENPGQKEINFWVSDAVILTEDTVIPKNTRLFVYDSSGNGAATLTVGEGATLTTRDIWYFECNVPLTIAGKWVNQAWGVELKKGLTITSTGSVDSTEGRIDLTGTLVNDGVLVENSSISQTLNIDSMDGLKSAVRGVGYGGTVKVQVGADFTISESFTVPKGVYLNIQSGSGSFKIAEGVIFTTESEFNCYVPMTVEGTWLNQSAYVKDLTISSGGSVENNGSLNASNFRVEGSLKNGEQASISILSNFALTTTGSLENYGIIYLYGDIELNGTVTEHSESHIYYTYKAKTLNELKELLKRVKSGDTVEVDPGRSAFVISENVSVPEGVRLNIFGDLVINAGMTFSTANLNVHGVTVNGTWENRGDAYCQEEVYVADTGVIRHSKGHDFYCWGGLRIAEGGLVENNGYLHIEEKYENCGTLVNNTGATARLMLSVRNAAELKAALACENPGEKEITFLVSDAVTLTEDVVIPENTWLRVHDSTSNGKAVLAVGEGATLTTQGSWECFSCNIPLTIAGKWVNHAWGVTLKKGLTITSTGCVDSTGGSIELTGAFVNNGALVRGSNIYQTLNVSSMDELKSAMQGVAPRGTVEILGNSDFIISKDITIPKGITVEVYEGIQKLRLDAGAELTIDTGATLRSYAPVEVNGMVYNYGSIGARRGLAVNGTIHNYDYIRVEGGEFIGKESVITHEAGTCAIRQNYFVDSEQALNEVLAEVDLGRRNWNTITVAEGLTLNGDTTIPRGVYLKIQSGTFKVNTGANLVTYDNLDVAGSMIVDGHWTNNYGIAISSVVGEFVVNGTVENGGHLELRQYTEAFQKERIQNVDRGRIDYNLTVYSLAELRNLIAHGVYWPMSVYWLANDTVVLDNDLSIPDNMSLRINGQRTTLIIPEGVTLCAEAARFDLDASYASMIIQGTLRTGGNCEFNTIEVFGLLENAGGLSFDNMLITDSGKVANAGVMVGEVDNQGELCNIDRTDAGKAFELKLRRNCDWSDVFRNIRHGDSVRFTSFGDNSYIVVSEDTTLSEGVSLHSGNFKITENAIFTTNAPIESVSTMSVDGVWVNNSVADAYRIEGTGTICNAGSIAAYEIGDEVKITRRPIQKEEDDSVIYASELNLQESLDAAKRGQIVRCVRNQIYDSGQCGIIFNEDVTVPEGVTLQFAGAFKVYFAANHTLIVNGTLVAAQPIYIAGILVINGEVSIPAVDEVDVEYMQYLGVTMGGINIVDGGACEINGSIRVGKTDYNGQTIADPSAVLDGIDMSALTQRDADRCWHLTKKTAEDRADIFCELPTTGCSLRLVGADGSVKELAPAGEVAAITNIAPGRYTLEASKPGYVTHSVSVDTAAIADAFVVELVMVGDINGCASEWGNVDVTDMACLYTLLSTGSYDGQIKDEEYMKRVADVNGDGIINILDYQRLYMVLK